MTGPIIGIDLGTTNSEVAIIRNSKPVILEENGNNILPSCVGVDDSGKVIVGEVPRNQAILYPDRTVLSIKRLMGSGKSVMMADKTYTPQEISAFILRELKEQAERVTGHTVTRAIITTPAYFTDAQRYATREAGEIAGLTVVRILNEPTAAALAYESSNSASGTIMVYDLGGGTFDVSIVRIESGIVEVLASTGDNLLGGDDFDLKISELLREHILEEFGLDISTDKSVLTRLKRAAEKAKIELSTVPFASIEEDHLLKDGTKDIHFSYELSRQRFEALIEDFLLKTMDSVTKALKDASILPSQLDKIILVGGSTRIPMISAILEEKLNLFPNKEVDPDLCVALGASIQAGREMGIDVSGVLLDVTPYTFGTAAIGPLNGEIREDVFVPLIRRNSKLPTLHSEAFTTVTDNQRVIDVAVYQGEEPYAPDNILIGNYEFKLSPQPKGSLIIIKFELDINGILKMHCLEKSTGRNISGVIENAFSTLSEAAVSASRDKINGMWHNETSEIVDNIDEDDALSASGMPKALEDLIASAKAELDNASPEDREEIIDLIEDIRDAVTRGREDEAAELGDELDDILFYIQ